MKVLIEAELVEKKDGAVRVRLVTGFGDPVVLVDEGRLQFVDVALAAAR